MSEDLELQNQIAALAGRINRHKTAESQPAYYAPEPQYPYGIEIFSSEATWTKTASPQVIIQGGHHIAVLHMAHQEVGDVALVLHLIATGRSFSTLALRLLFPLAHLNRLACQHNYQPM